MHCLQHFYFLLKGKHYLLNAFSADPAQMVSLIEILQLFWPGLEEFFHYYLRFYLCSRNWPA